MTLYKTICLGDGSLEFATAYLAVGAKTKPVGRYYIPVAAPCLVQGRLRARPPLVNGINVYFGYMSLVLLYLIIIRIPSYLNYIAQTFLLITLRWVTWDNMFFYMCE